MKQMKHLLALLLAPAAAILLSACGGDDADKLDPTIRAERNALLASTQYGIYQEGRDSFVFNKTLHQLYVNPSKNIYRIQTDAGTRFAELPLAGPRASTSSISDPSGRIGSHRKRVPGTMSGTRFAFFPSGSGIGPAQKIPAGNVPTGQSIPTTDRTPAARHSVRDRSGLRQAGRPRRTRTPRSEPSAPTRVRRDRGGQARRKRRVPEIDPPERASVRCRLCQFDETVLPL